MVVHRDRFDPSVGLGHAMAHILLETQIGSVVLATGVVVGGGLFVATIVNAFTSE